MSLSQVPSEKIGTLFQKPAWRFEAMQNPQAYGFASFVSKKTEEGTPGYLKRLVPKDLKAVSAYKWPAFFSSMATVLPTELYDELIRVRNKSFYKLRKKKIEFKELDKCKELLSWNMSKIEKLNDVWLRALVAHVFNYKYDKDIDFALRIYRAEINVELKRYIGFSIFAGLTDAEIARNWKVTSERSITAFRHLFYDFSHLPKNKVAMWSVLRQLMLSGDIPEDDFGFYKRIYDLGRLGLEAQVAYLHMPKEDQRKIQEYLSNTTWINTYNMDFCIRTSKDAMNYNRVIGDLSKNGLAEEIRKQKAAETEILKLTKIKMEKEILSDTAVEQPNDCKLIENYVRTVSEYDAEPKFVTMLQLKGVAEEDLK